MLEDFLDIISDAKKLNNKRTSKSINIKIFSNSIINPIDQIIKYYLNKKDVPSYIEFAEFNTLLPSKSKSKFNIALIVWECENLFPNNYDDLEEYSLKDCNNYIESFKKNFEYFLRDISKYQYLIIKKLNPSNYISINLILTQQGMFPKISIYIMTL